MNAITFALLALGYQPGKRQPLVVEDHGPIVGTGTTTEASGIETLSLSPHPNSTMSANNKKL